MLIDAWLLPVSRGKHMHPPGRPGGGQRANCAYSAINNTSNPLSNANAPNAPIRLSIVMAYHYHQANPVSLACARRASTRSAGPPSGLRVGP